MVGILRTAKVALIAFLPLIGFGQTFGPNSPTQSANNTGAGTNAWSTPANIYTSNDVRSTVGLKGNTNLLQGRDFGFSLTETDIVDGIRLDVEKSTVSVNDVSMLGSWTVGTTRPALAAGENRCLIVFIGLENATARDIASVTYGNRPMTLLGEVGVGNPIFYGRTEAWYMLESDLALTSGTSISYTFTASVPAENFEIVSSGLFRFVDQFAPFFDIETTSSITTNPAMQLANPVNFIPGSVTISGCFSGAPPAAGGTRSNSNAFAINGGFTETVDYHDYNDLFSTSGGAFQVAQLFNSTTGSTQPTITSNGTPNRRTVVAFTLRRARNWDNTVRILKNGTATSANLANVNVEWPAADAYTSYGGAFNLWGTTWLYTDINNSNFGGEISAFVQNATVGVDHMRISIFTHSTLPVELISFTAQQMDRSVLLNWQSGSESNLDYYQVEHSTDGVHFMIVGTRVEAVGNTVNLSSYSTIDPAPAYGMNYYRLKSVDTDGQYKYSDLAPVLISDETEEIVFPNPTNNWAVLTVNSGYDEIVIMDLTGRIIDQFPGTEIPADVKLNLNDAKDGQYLICIKRSGETTVKRVTKTSREL